MENISNLKFSKPSKWEVVRVVVFVVVEVDVVEVDVVVVKSIGKK